jgi:hypothetical protein
MVDERECLDGRWEIKRERWGRWWDRRLMFGPTRIFLPEVLLLVSPALPNSLPSHKVWLGLTDAFIKLMMTWILYKNRQCEHFLSLKEP